MTTCTICGQQDLIDELDEHMHIEVLDPRWKIQRDALEAHRATANEQQSSSSVAVFVHNSALLTRLSFFRSELRVHDDASVPLDVEPLR